jgi:hypothetical protein
MKNTIAGAVIEYRYPKIGIRDEIKHGQKGKRDWYFNKCLIPNLQATEIESCSVTLE